MSDRVGFVKSQYKAAVFARCGRILPAFGLGGIGNRMLRSRWRSSVLAECKPEGKQD